MKQASTEVHSKVLEAPDWLKEFFPDLPGTIVFTPVMIAELEKAHSAMQKDKHDTESLPDSAFAQFGLTKPTWTPEYMRAKFVGKYVKNFSHRVTRKDEAIYKSSRASGAKLSDSFQLPRDNCADELKDATWGQFYADIDTALVETGVRIERAQIQELFASHDTEGERLQGQINVALFPAVLLLRSKGYALYPDLTL